MDIFEKLAALILREHQQGELPDYLVEPLQHIASHPEHYRDQIALVEQLHTQLEEFDPYSDCGCFGEGFTVADLITTLKKLGIDINTAPPTSCTLS